jgi:hypothetical protein
MNSGLYYNLDGEDEYGLEIANKRRRCCSTVEGELQIFVAVHPCLVVLWSTYHC